MTLSFWLLIALLLDRAQLQIGAFSYASHWNGMGTIDDVLARRTPAPMAYRVLVPALIGGLERLIPALNDWRLTVYEACKIAALTAALALTQQALGLTAALLVAAMLPATFGFDYWCWAIELAAFAAALTGSIPLTLVGCLLLALSRETAPLVPLTFALVTGNLGVGLQLLALTGATMLIARLAVGYRPLYCDRFMARRNWTELRLALSKQPLAFDYSAFAVLLTVLTLGVVVSGQAGAAWIVPLIVLALGWSMGVAREVRIFTPVLLWIAQGMIHP